MRIILLGILSLLAATGLSSCGSKSTAGTASTTSTAGTEVTLVTYNVGVFSKSGSNTTGMIAQMLKEMGADVVSLNELDSCTTRNPSFQIRDLATEMGGWDWNFAPAIDYKGGKYGVGIIAAPGMEILSRKRLTLDKGDGAEQRALAVCVFRDFVFCSTHLDHRSADAQYNQAKQINSWIEATYGATDKPVFLCGDFNALPGSATLVYMRDSWTVISPNGFTFSAKNPSKCIDYIMVYKNAASRVEVLSAVIPTSFRTGSVSIASDHLPVLVKVKLN